MWFIGVEVEQETSAPPPEKNPGSAPENSYFCRLTVKDWNALPSEIVNIKSADRFKKVLFEYFSH